MDGTDINMTKETDGQSGQSSRLLFLLFHGVLVAFCIRIYQDRAAAAARVCKRLDELLGGGGCRQRIGMSRVCLVRVWVYSCRTAVNVDCRLVMRSAVAVTLRILGLGGMGGDSDS